MGLAIPGVLGAGAVGAIAGAVGAWWLHRRTRLSALNVYVFAPVGVAVFVGALATLQGVLIAATAPFVVAGVGGAAIARRLRLAALGAGGELREFEQARVMLWATLTGGALGRRRDARDRGDRTLAASGSKLSG